VDSGVSEGGLDAGGSRRGCGLDILRCWVVFLGAVGWGVGQAAEAQLSRGADLCARAEKKEGHPCWDGLISGADGSRLRRLHHYPFSSSFPRPVLQGTAVPSNSICGHPRGRSSKSNSLRSSAVARRTASVSGPSSNWRGLLGSVNEVSSPGLHLQPASTAARP
jgi:hypothetical protein